MDVNAIAAKGLPNEMTPHTGSVGEGGGEGETR